MDFQLSEDQEMLRSVCRTFMARTWSPKLARELEIDPTGFRADTWKQIAELGWIGLLIPEDYGGAGGGMTDMAVLFQEMGRALFDTPLLDTIIGADLVLLGGTDELKRELLPRIAGGDLTLASAFSEPDVDYDFASMKTAANLANGQFRISGKKIFVPYANVVSHIICAAKTSGAAGKEGTTLLLVDTTTPGISLTPLRTALNDHRFEVSFDDVRASPENVLGTIDRGWDILQTSLAKATIAKCAEMVGVAQKILEMTVQYAKERVQFNHPIGSFQAVQHHCANMVISLQTAELVAYKAAWAVEKGLPYAKEVSRAKAWVNEACRKIAALGHQVHGGMGFALEHDLHLYSRRCEAWEFAFGDTEWHYKQLARHL